MPREWSRVEKENVRILIPYQAPAKAYASPEVELPGIRIRRSGLLLNSKVEIIQDGKKVCEILAFGDIKVDGRTVGNIPAFSLLSYENKRTWVNLKTHDWELQARCVHDLRKRCARFLGFRLLKDGKRFGYMVCELDSQSLFKGSMLQSHSSYRWFPAYCAMAIRKEIAARD